MRSLTMCQYKAESETYAYLFLLLSSLVFSFSLDECRNIIIQYGVREVTASQVARVLGMMARTHSGLTDGIPLQVSVLFSPVFGNQSVSLLTKENTNVFFSLHS